MFSGDHFSALVGEADELLYYLSYVDSVGRQTLYYGSYYPVDEGAVGNCL